MKQLVDENRISTEKIGASTYYWVFKADKS